MTTSTATAAIEASGLVKSFGTVLAVDGLDLSVPRGGVFALLGPNGAGKTTTIRIFATLTKPDAGRARVLGHDVTTAPQAVRSGICLTGQFASVDPSLTGRENLVLYARLLGLARRTARERAVEMLDAFGLADAGDRPARTYSGGMRRRLDIAVSLVVAPALLFLDEPTTGLDPYSRLQVWEAVRWLVTQGTTVLLTTQYLDEADQLSDRIAVIDQGRMVAEGTPGQLKSAVGSGVLRVRLADATEAGRARRELAGALGVPVLQDTEPATLTATIDSPSAAETAADGLSLLARAGIEVASFALGQPSLDEVFLALTGHAATNTNNEEPQ
jgi:ABC-2 type transport system ATP-binding protein